MATKPMMKKSATKRRFKRYDEGGMTEEDAKRAGLEASKGETVGFLERLRMGNIDDPKSEAYARFGAGRGRAGSPAVKATGTPDMPSSAGDDYEDRISAREASTYRQSDADEAASKKSTAKSAAKPSGGPGRKPSGIPGSTRSGGPSAAELKAYAAQKAAAQDDANRAALRKTESYKRTDYSRPAEEPGLENLSGDFIGGPAKLGAAALGAAATALGLRSLMRRGAKAGAEQMVRRGSPELGYEATKRIGMSEGRKALPAPPKALPGPKGAAAEVEDVVAKGARDDVTNPLAWMMGPKGVLGKKNGGAIKAKAFASGGAVSASKRADGIASRGKTRGKIC